MTTGCEKSLWRSRSPIFISQHTFVFWACSATIASCSSVLKKLISGHSSPSLCVSDLQITYRKRKNPFSYPISYFCLIFFFFHVEFSWWLTKKKVRIINLNHKTLLHVILHVILCLNNRKETLMLCINELARMCLGCYELKWPGNFDK